MAKVFVNGRFCILHSGHFNLLNHARRYAGFDGKVMVCIDTDERIAATDHRLPIFPLATRMNNIRILKCLDRPLVDHVLAFNTDEYLIQAIKLFKPDYMVKGTDWFGRKVIGQDLIPTMIWYDVDGGENKISSSKIIQTILNKYGKSGL